MISYFSEVYHATLHLLYLRLYTEATLKYGSGDYHCVLVIPEEGKETKVTSLMLKKETDGNPGWYGTKEELKDTEDFFPFVLLKLGVPAHLKD
jgi:V-type H+-transporting ATPase subunit C